MWVSKYDNQFKQTRHAETKYVQVRTRTPFGEHVSRVGMNTDAGHKYERIEVKEEWKKM